MKMVSSIRYLCDRLIKTAHRFKEKDKNFFVSYLPLMLNQEPQTLQEALQKFCSIIQCFGRLAIGIMG